MVRVGGGILCCSQVVRQVLAAKVGAFRRPKISYSILVLLYSYCSAVL